MPDLASPLRSEALADAIRLEGIDGWVVAGLVPEALHAPLATAFPATPFAPVDAPQGPTDRPEHLGARLQALPVEDAAALPSPWRTLVDALAAGPYAAACEELTGLPVTRARPTFRFTQYRAGGFLGPHWDGQRHKILTQVVYANATWRRAWGGQYQFLAPQDPHDVIASLPVSMGLTVFNASTPRAWHSVAPVSEAAPDTRRALLVEWYAR